MAVPREQGKWPRQLTLDGSRLPLPDPAQAELTRFAAKVVPDPRPGGCQHWTGAIGGDGYGRFHTGAGPVARTVRAHLWVFERAHGVRPVRARVLHCCDETGCVALEHLAAGTQAQNVAQMHARGRGRRRHTAATDLRGAAGRARAIRAALTGGWDEAAFTAALAAGDPFAHQLALPVDVAGGTPVREQQAGTLLLPPEPQTHPHRKLAQHGPCGT